MKEHKFSALAQTTGEKFAARDKRLGFVAGSPLNSVTDWMDNNLYSEDEPSTETKLTTLSNSIAGVIEKEIQHYRTVVQPRLAAFFNDLKSNIAKSNIEHPLMDFNIVRIALPDWLTNGVLKTEVESFKGRMATSTRSVTLPENIPVEELRSMLLTEMGAVDETIGNWLGGISDERIVKAWHSYLAGPGTALAPTLTSISDMDDVALAYLWVRNLADNPREDVKADLATYSNYLAEAKVKLGADLASNIGRLVSASGLGNVVLSANQKTKNIFVYDTTYEAWLQTGGDSDTIIGWFLSTDRFSSATGAFLTENQEKYRTALNKFYSLHEVRTNANLARNLATHTEIAFRKFLRDEEELAADVDTQIIFDFIKHLPSELCTIESLPRRVSEISIEIIAGNVFGNTNAKAFFTEMGKLEATVGTVTPDELFSLVGMKTLLVHYLLANTEVK